MNNNLYTEYEETRSTRSFMYGVYGWMTLGLGITGVISYVLSMMPAFFAMLYHHPGLLLVIGLTQLGLVMLLSARGLVMSFTSALICFLLYAASVGVSLTAIFVTFTRASLVQTFFITAGTFAVMALYGYLTRSDLSGMRGLLLMMLFGLIIGTLVNLFMRNSYAEIVLSGFGVLIFMLFTAYDVQNIKNIPTIAQQYGLPIKQAALMGALTLYLDFINLFIFMLNLTGRQKE